MALPTTSSQPSVRSRASSPSRRELRRILSDPDAVGRAFWVWASPDEAIFAAAAEHSSAALSDRMQRRKEQILSASSTGDYEKFGRKRVCILVTAQKKISEKDLIAFIPTTTLNHGAFALESADKYIQALAVAIDDTPPWPTADSPTVNMVPKWEATPCYALARVIDVSVARVVAIHIPESRIANLSALLDLAEDRVEAGPRHAL